MKHTHNENIRREQGREKIFKAIITDNFTKLMKDNKSYIQKVQRTPGRINSRVLLLDITVKLQKTKKKMLEETREKRKLYL